MSLDFFNNPNFLLLQTSALAFLNLLVPLIFDRHKFLKRGMLLTVSGMFFINILNIDHFYLSGGRTSFELLSLGGFAIKFHLEGMGLLFLTMVSFLWIPAGIYTSSFIKHEKFENSSTFLCFIAAAIFITTLISFAANLLTLFVFYEILTLITIPLILHNNTTSPQAQKAIKIYSITLLRNATLFFLPLIIVVNYYCGSTDFIAKGILDNKIENSSLIIVLLLMTLFGLAKTALLPFYYWLTNAMVASYPVSALFHAVVVVKVGIFSLYKIVIYIFGLDFLHSILGTVNWIIYIPIITTLYASILATQETNIKKLLAYSTISQLSMSIMPLFLFNTKGVIAGILHMIAHSIAKITLFYTAGNIYISTRATHIDHLYGTGFSIRSMGLCFLAGSWALIGIPPFCSFVSKYYIIQAIVSSDEFNYTALVFVLMASILTAIYMFRIILRIYKPIPQTHISKTNNNPELHNPIPKPMLYCTIALALLSLGFFSLTKTITQFLEFVY